MHCNSKFPAILITLVIVFLIPIFLSHLLIQKITQKEFVKATKFEFVNISPTLSCSTNNADTSGKGNLTTSQKFKNFDKWVNSLILFNIQPDLIKFSLYLDNNVTLEMSYTDLKSGQRHTSVFDFTLLCDETEISVSHSPNSKGILLKDDLILNNGPNNNKNDFDKIYNNCVSTSKMRFQNTTGSDIRPEPEVRVPNDAGIGLTIEPNGFTKVIIYFLIWSFYAGFLILLRETAWKFYRFIFGKISAHSQKSP